MSDDFASAVRERARTEVAALPVDMPDVAELRAAAEAAERRHRRGWVAGALCLVLVISAVTVRGLATEPSPILDATPAPDAPPVLSPPEERPTPTRPAAAAGSVDGRDAAVLASAPALSDSYALHASVTNTGEGWLLLPGLPPLVHRWDGRTWVDADFTSSGGNAFREFRPGEAADVRVEAPAGGRFEPGWYQVGVIIHAGADQRPVFEVAALTLVPAADTDVLALLPQMPQEAPSVRESSRAPEVVVSASTPQLDAELTVSVHGEAPAAIDQILAFPYVDGMWVGPVTVGEGQWGQPIDAGASLVLEDPWAALDPDLLYEVRVLVRPAEDDSETAPRSSAVIYVGGRG